MPRVRFLADFDFKPSSQVTMAYRRGEEKLVTTPCAEAAIGKGKAELIDTAEPAGIAATIAKTPRRRRAAGGR